MKKLTHIISSLVVFAILILQYCVDRYLYAQAQVSYDMTAYGVVKIIMLFVLGIAISWNLHELQEKQVKNWFIVGIILAYIILMVVFFCVVQDIVTYPVIIVAAYSFLLLKNICGNKE